MNLAKNFSHPNFICFKLRVINLILLIYSISILEDIRFTYYNEVDVTVLFTKSKVTQFVIHDRPILSLLEHWKNGDDQFSGQMNFASKMVKKVD